MKPSQLNLFRRYDRPAFDSAGGIIAALSTPNVDKDRYDGVLHHFRDGSGPISFTTGPRDSAPVTSPDGMLVVFLRAGEDGPQQLYAMPTTGGEPISLTDHPLGASAATFSPDGRSITYLAAVPEAGRYGTPIEESEDSADAPKPEAEAPRRITTLRYRSDGKGFVSDKPEQVHILDLTDIATGRPGKPRGLTDEQVPLGRPVFTPDGRSIVYTRSAGADSLRTDIAIIDADLSEPGRGRRLVETAGDAESPVVHGDTLYYIGTEFDDNDFAGRNPGLWAAPLAGGEPRRLTDSRTVHVEAAAGPPIVLDDTVIVGVADRGSVSLRAVPTNASTLTLESLPTLIGGPRVVLSFSARSHRIAAAVADSGSCGDLVTGTFSELLLADDAAVAWTRLTDVSAALRGDGLARTVEISGTAPDGYPVHGWLVLPPEDTFTGPHPVLLNVHGGPHAAYGWGVFDEAQMYATHGYAVVLPNPRGSAGYGEAHGRAIVGALGTVDADDVLALLDAAVERPDLDRERVGVMGGSYGGYMTSWLASHAPERFVAGISERAVNAWDSFVGSSDIGYFFADGYVGSDPAEQRHRSPLSHAGRIGIPLLIIHSEHDWRCPVEQAQRLYVALKSRGAETEMLLFPGEGHELSRSGRPRHRRQRFEAILEWWGRYLPV